MEYITHPEITILVDGFLDGIFAKWNGQPDLHIKTLCSMLGMFYRGSKKLTFHLPETLSVENYFAGGSRLICTGTQKLPNLQSEFPF